MLEDIIEDDGIERANATQVLREDSRINSEATVARHSSVGSRLVALHDHPATLGGFEKPPFFAPGLQQARILKGFVTAETIEQRFEIPAPQIFNPFHRGTYAGSQARFHVSASRTRVEPNIHLAHCQSAGWTFLGISRSSFHYQRRPLSKIISSEDDACADGLLPAPAV